MAPEALFADTPRWLASGLVTVAALWTLLVIAMFWDIGAALLKRAPAPVRGGAAAFGVMASGFLFGFFLYQLILELGRALL